jgi:inhibitor of cysteine peptidase
MPGLKQRMWHGGILVALFVSLALIAGCGSKDEIAIGEKENGTRVELEQGQTLAITLGSNPSTGYSWAPDEGPSGDVLILIGEPEFKSQSNLVGASGTEALRFRADRVGETTLKLNYRRPWEKEVEPAETYTVTVHVR